MIITGSVAEIRAAKAIDSLIVKSNHLNDVEINISDAIKNIDIIEPKIEYISIVPTLLMNCLRLVL